MKVTRLISSTALLAALFVLVTHTAAAQQPVFTAQQAPVPTGVTVPASSASVSSPSALPGPRLSPEFHRAEPTLGSSAAVAGSNTITISTLVLVLAVILIVLLVA
jgi:hypothetical protein